MRDIRQGPAGEKMIASFKRAASSLPAGIPETNSLPLSDTFSPYLDVGDNVYASVSSWLDTNCGSDDNKWFIPGKCENGHSIAKVIVCGKEWCPVCGQKNSIAHNRRFVRWLPKIQQMTRLSYLVFTIPAEVRAEYRTKEALRRIGHSVQVMLKRHGYKRGLRRWHWFGDKSHKWHPHINVLLDGAYIPAGELAKIKQDWADILGVGVAVVHHSYKRRSGEMAGCLNYNTRATFLDYTWDIEMAEEIRGFRNMVVWGRGKWDDKPVWSLDEPARQASAGEALGVKAIQRIVNHECPVCGSHLTWGEAAPGRILSLVDKEPYGAGYFRVIPHNERHERGDYRRDWHNRMLDEVRWQREANRILMDEHLARKHGNRGVDS